MDFFEEIGKAAGEAVKIVGEAADNAVKEVSKVTNLDPDAIKSVATGGVAGAGLSGMVGGMGLAVGGTAVGIGMLPVAALGAVVGLGAFGLSKAFQKKEDENDTES
jgi:hypothetical protein